MEINLEFMDQNLKGILDEQFNSDEVSLEDFYLGDQRMS